MSENTPNATPETAPTEAAGDNATFVSDPVLSSSPAEPEAHAAPAHAAPAHAHAPAPTHAPAAAHAPAHAAHAAAPAPAVHAGISVDERAYEQYQALAKTVLADDKTKKAMADAEARLGNSGRILVRKSGTEPLIRVMAEGDDKALVHAVVDQICDALPKATA